MRRTISFAPSPSSSLARPAIARLGNPNHHHASKILPTPGDYAFNEPGGPFHTQFPSQSEHPVTGVALELENAKRRAADASARAALGEEQRQEALEAEMEVVRCRLRVLNELIHSSQEQEEGQDDPHLCLRADSAKYQPCASVLYRRLLMAPGGHALHPVQAPVAWKTSRVIHWEALSPLYPKDGDADSQVPNDLLCQLVADAVRMATRDETTTKLRELYWKHNALKEHLVFERAERGAGLEAERCWQAPEPCRHSVEVLYQAKSREPIDGEHVLVDVLWGTLLMNHCEPWHNPLINEYVQKAILAAGGHQGSAPSPLRNFVRPVVRIIHDKEVHVLILAPFLKPDSCTVQHIHVRDEEPDRGIIAQHPAARVHIERVGKMEYFHCAGARPNARFNEQELNYVHSMGWRPHKAELERPNVDPGQRSSGPLPAKSARISFADWDVLITTYNNTAHGGGGSRTVLTLFNYPPQGVRYAKDPLDPEQAGGGGGGRGGDGYQLVRTFKNGRRGYRYTEIRPAAARVRQTKVRLEDVPFYVTWFHDANTEPHKETRIYAMDTNVAGPLAFEMRQKFREVRATIGFEYHDHWIESVNEGEHLSFVQNIMQNESRKGGLTPRERYRQLWGTYLTHFVLSAHDRAIGHGVPFDPPYEHACPVVLDNPQEVWADIFWCANIANAQSLVEMWVIFTDERVKEDPHKRFENRGRLKALPPARTADARGRRPAAHLGRAESDAGGNDAVIQTLRAQIRDLHALNENRDHLLRQVLERLGRR